MNMELYQGGNKQDEEDGTDNDVVILGVTIGTYADYDILDGCIVQYTGFVPNESFKEDFPPKIDTIVFDFGEGIYECYREFDETPLVRNSILVLLQDCI